MLNPATKLAVASFCIGCPGGRHPAKKLKLQHICFWKWKCINSISDSEIHVKLDYKIKFIFHLLLIHKFNALIIRMASLFLCNLMYVFLAPFYFVDGRKINIELSHFPQFILKEAEQGVNFLDSTCFSCKVNVSFFSVKAFVMIHQSIYHTSIKSDGAKPSWVNTKCVYHIPHVYEKCKRLFCTYILMRSFLTLEHWLHLFYHSATWRTTNW